MNSLAFLLQAAMNCSIFSTSSFILRKEIRRHVLIDVAQEAQEVLVTLEGLALAFFYPRIAPAHSARVESPRFRGHAPLSGEGV